ncbi:hypothetical protein M3J09_012859 [Ascochyta lentis]
MRMPFLRRLRSLSSLFAVHLEATQLLFKTSPKLPTPSQWSIAGAPLRRLPLRLPCLAARQTTALARMALCMRNSSISQCVEESYRFYTCTTRGNCKV